MADQGDQLAGGFQHHLPFQPGQPRLLGLLHRLPVDFPALIAGELEFLRLLAGTVQQFPDRRGGGKQEATGPEVGPLLPHQGGGKEGLGRQGGARRLVNPGVRAAPVDREAQPAQSRQGEHGGLQGPADGETAIGGNCMG